MGTLKVPTYEHYMIQAHECTPQSDCHTVGPLKCLLHPHHHHHHARLKSGPVEFLMSISTFNMSILTRKLVYIIHIVDP